jgi:hypothetical protein
MPRTAILPPCPKLTLPFTARSRPRPASWGFRGSMFTICCAMVACVASTLRGIGSRSVPIARNTSATRRSPAGPAPRRPTAGIEICRRGSREDRNDPIRPRGHRRGPCRRVPVLDAAARQGRKNPRRRNRRPMVCPPVRRPGIFEAPHGRQARQPGYARETGPGPSPDRKEMILACRCIAGRI